MKLKVSEKDIQKSILEWLQLKKYFCWRNNTGGFKNSKGHFYRFGSVGSGDILGLTRSGQFFSIEVKAPGKKPTDQQAQFIEEVKRNGGISFVAHSLEDVELRM
jgi:hypothetical protein